MILELIRTSSGGGDRLGGRRRRRVVSLLSIRAAVARRHPDISDPQIVVYVKWPRSPQLLESQVTEPLASALAGVDGDPGDPGQLAHGVRVHLGFVLNGRQRRRTSEAGVDRINAIRRLSRPTASITLWAPMPAAWAGSTSTPDRSRGFARSG
jgi:hypothetical protein